MPNEQMSAEELDGLIGVLEGANPLWPLYVGHPKTGDPIELSKQAYQQILASLKGTATALASSNRRSENVRVLANKDTD